MSGIVVVDYDQSWPDVFEEFRARLAPVVGDVAIAIEHVGSTAVIGLAAKPIIDIDVIVAGKDAVKTAIERLATIGYVHQGDLGIEGREAFRSPTALPPHHLYVCPQGNLALRNHLAIRDALRSDPEATRRYGELKKQLATVYHDDIDRYVAGKTEFLVELLRNAKLSDTELDTIARANRLPDAP